MISMMTLWLLYGGLFAMATAQACTFAWRQFTNESVLGGAVDVLGTTEAKCRSLCESDSNCVTYDFSPGGVLHCFTHTYINIGGRIPNAGVNHYQYGGMCTLADGTNCQFWYEGQYESPADLTASPGITSETDCLLDCISKPTCISASFLPGGTCQLSALKTNALDGRTPVVGRRHYLKDQTNCDVVTTDTTSPPCNQAPLDCNVVSRGDCEPTSYQQAMGHQCGIGYMWEEWDCPNQETRRVRRFCCREHCLNFPCDNPHHKHLRCPRFGDSQQVSEEECWEAGCCWDEYNPWGFQCHISSTNDLSCDKVFPNCEY